jgi:murein DD-endopeptidase MepM/ murein hydrolase activator NlpD
MQKLNINHSSMKFYNMLKSSVIEIARFFRMRHRYMLTKQNQLRLRYMTSLGVFVIAAMASFGALIPHSEAHYGKTDDIFANAVEVIQSADGSQAIIDGTALGQLSLASMTARSIPHPSSRIVTIEPGDALSVVLEREGVGDDTPKTIKALSEHFDPRDMRAGDKIHLAYAPDSDGQQQFKALKIKLDPLRTVIVKRGEEGFESNIDEKSVERVVHAKKATIENSLFGSAEKAGIPRGIVAEAMRIYSWNVDFQRDIRKGDTLEVMYETFETGDGFVAKNGDVLYANLSVRGQEIPLYRFEMSDGRVDFFQPNGRSMKRTLMKTPIDGARLSSGYGLRKHPVLGYKKMHKGVDFAAPTGTPIYAAGDGVIEKAGWFSSYGKYIRIRHNSELKTAYAHMSRIKAKQGTRVKQGDVIGYVGTTGRSTGAHLHYEVLLNGQQTNPRSVNLPTGEKLTGNQLAKFKEASKETSRKFASLLDDTKVASRDEEKESKLN